MRYLKRGHVWQRDYANHSEATADIADYIACLYNPVRLHLALFYQSPVERRRSGRRFRPVGEAVGQVGAGQDEVVGFENFGLAELGQASPRNSQEFGAEVEALNSKTLTKVEPMRLFPGDARDQLDFTTAKRTPLVFEFGNQLCAIAT